MISSSLPDERRPFKCRNSARLRVQLKLTCRSKAAVGAIQARLHVGLPSVEQTEVEPAFKETPERNLVIKNGPFRLGQKRVGFVRGERREEPIADLRLWCRMLQFGPSKRNFAALENLTHRASDFASLRQNLDHAILTLKPLLGERRACSCRSCHTLSFFNTAISTDRSPKV